MNIRDLIFFWRHLRILCVFCARLFRIRFQRLNERHTFFQLGLDWNWNYSYWRSQTERTTHQQRDLEPRVWRKGRWFAYNVSFSFQVL